jgi:hypothetical protein
MVFEEALDWAARLYVNCTFSGTLVNVLVFLPKFKIKIPCAMDRKVFNIDWQPSKAGFDFLYEWKDQSDLFFGSVAPACSVRVLCGGLGGIDESNIHLRKVHSVLSKGFAGAEKPGGYFGRKIG